MRIILINPSVSLGSRSLAENAISGNLINYLGEFQPLGLLYIAANLKLHGYNDVTIIDAQADNLTPAQLAEKTAKLKPEVIGIYCLTFSFLYVLELARLLKSKIACPIVVGGPQVSLYPQEVLSHQDFDFGVSGEGEEVFLKLVQYLENSQGQDLAGFAGLIYRQDNAVQVNPVELIRNLDTLPLPARELLPQKKYFRNYRHARFTSLLSTRGCPYKCSYCSHIQNYDAVRFLSPQKVLEEIQDCIQRFGTKCFQFFDDTFLLDKTRALEICRLIQARGLKIEYLISTRVDLLDEDLARALSQSGCKCVSLGVESADQGILDFLDKGISVEQSRQAIALCRKYNLDSVIFIMVGLPAETKQTIKNTVEFIKAACPRWLKTNIFVPYPGSPIYDQLVRQGAITDFWRTMTLTGQPPRIPNVCKNFSKRDLSKICSQLNLMPYFRFRSNLFNFHKLRHPRNVIWSLRWLIKLILNLFR